MVEPATDKPEPQALRQRPPTLLWPSDSPLDPAVNRFAGAQCYQIWRRGSCWTAVADGVHWWAVLAPRGWAVRYRQWTLLGIGLLPAVAAMGLVLAGTPAWTPGAWLPLLLADGVLRARAGCLAGRWRSLALQRAGWQPVTRLRAISVNDAVTTAQIRASHPRR